MPAKICLDVMPTEVCKVVVYINMRMIATEDFSVEDRFSTKEIEVNQDKVILDQNVSVQIQIYGGMKMTGFAFV